MLNKYSFLLVFLFLLVSFLSSGQAQHSLKFEHLTADDGLSQSSVTCILKDRYGFMWFGTRDGLNRYDSYEFQQYKNQSTDSSSISNNTISCLFEDHLGMIWVGTEGGGLNLYNPTTDRFSPFLHDPSDPGSLPENTISSVTEDEQGNLWIATKGGGLSMLDMQRQRFRNFMNDPHDSLSLASNTVTSVIRDSQGLIWLTTEGAGLAKFDPSTGNFRHYRHDPENPATICSDLVNLVYEDKTGRLWILSWGFGFSIFDKRTGEFRNFKEDRGDPHALQSSNIFAITEDKHGNVWLGTRNGLSLFNPHTETFTNHRSIPGNPHSLSHDVAFSLLYDEMEEILWIGTWGDGINILNRNGRHTEHYQNIPEVENSLSNNAIFAFLEDKDGVLWIGTEGGGLNKYDRSTGVFRSYTHNPSDPGSISNNDVMCIHQDSNGALWIGTFGGGLNKFDPINEVFQTFRGENDKIFNLRTVLSIFEDSKGMLWLTTSLQGITRMDPITGQSTIFSDSSNTPERQVFNDILTIIEDHTGFMWFGTRNSGIIRFDPANEEFTYYQHDPHDAKSLGANGIYALHEDGEGNLWIGTRGSGLNVVKLPISEDAVFHKITTRDGLFNDWLFGIVEDSHGNIWACGEGISKIDKDTREVRSYYFTGSNQGASYRSPSTGHFFMGTEGFDVFHPDSLVADYPDSPILISRLSRYNAKELPGIAIPVPGIFTYDSMVFNYNDQMLAFEFLNLDYSRSERNYAYQLENFNSDWIRLGEERKITFTGLPAGDYKLRVKAMYPAGELSDKEANLVITILPPWWKSAWARVIYFILGISGLYGIFYWRTIEQRRKIRRKEIELKRERHLNDRLQQIDKLKDQFLANTSHELRTPLQGIIGLSETLREREQDSEKNRDLSMIISSGKRLANLVNSILDFSKLKSHDLTLDMKPVSPRSATDIVLRISQPMVKGKPVVLINDVSGGLPLIHADENRMQQILHNLVGNAIKFTEKGHVKVTGEVQDQFVEIGVEDTGIGIPDDKLEDIFKSFEQVEDSVTRQYLGTGLGLSITRKLVELMGGKISVSSNIGKGTIFTFTIPVSGVQLETQESPTDMNESIASAEVVHELPQSQRISANGHHRILIVDDEVINQQVLTNYLSSDNYYVDIASNGEEALEKISAGNSFDLILLDVMMPRLSGYEVCLQIREKHLSSELPVIMITARDQVEDLVHGFSTGANDYISKPFSKDELLSRIKMHLNLAKINKSNSKFIPIEFLRSIGKESIMDVKVGDQSLLEVTVMFTDIRSYTTISEAMSPDENFNFLNRYLSHISPVIRNNHGFVNQFLGDGIMAIFIESPDDALRAAIEMQRVIEFFNKEVAGEISHPISIGIGMHTGQLMMGILGDKDRMDASVVADTVNTASRMEGLTKYFGAPIVISETTLEGLGNGDEFNCRFLGKVKVKGKTKALKIYEAIDGNPGDVVDKKVASRKFFDDGLKEYLNRSFATASVNFEKVLKLNADDKATLLYLKNSARFMVDGVDDEWDGVESVEGK
jgi:signal transduction histidine kinase/ligand-binding sensor domain-containing protein/class 3 adenylate cyclase/ActR/RegA family two-component response regulator